MIYQKIFDNALHCHISAAPENLERDTKVQWLYERFTNSLFNELKLMSTLSVSQEGKGYYLFRLIVEKIEGYEYR